MDYMRICPKQKFYVFQQTLYFFLQSITDAYPGSFISLRRKVNIRLEPAAWGMAVAGGALVMDGSDSASLLRGG